MAQHATLLKGTDVFVSWTAPDYHGQNLVPAVRRRSSRRSALIATLAFSLLGGCSFLGAPGIHLQRMAKGEVPVPVGAAVRTNTTPMEPALACLADLIAQKGDKQRVIAVGEVKDYTGKYSINEGSAITQGGALMVYSALGKMGDAVAVAERYDPLVAERELGYIDRRQLGNGEEHTVNGAKVAWVPYFGGTIAQSDYFIVGGITELNYNIRSGGADIALNNIGPKVRTFTQSVAVDLRIVDSRSLIVLKTVSLTKQFTGYEVGANVFRFFGNDLFDITVGAKGQEPLQLGIRTALEEATIRLVSPVLGASPAQCLDLSSAAISNKPADELRKVLRLVSQTATSGLPAQPVSATEQPQALQTQGGRETTISFEFGNAALIGGGQAAFDEISSPGGTSSILWLLAPETENWDPVRRDALTEQRIAAAVAALASRGIPASAIKVVWRPASADRTVYRDASGMQRIARIEVKR
jgi:curli biogenesis system outer membrane secretion channel CsgG